VSRHTFTRAFGKSAGTTMPKACETYAEGARRYRNAMRELAK